MKNVMETMAKLKGEGNETKMLTGSGISSSNTFKDVVNALVNDTTFKVQSYDRKSNSTTEINLSDIIREDISKTIKNANFPQKTEVDDVTKTCNIATDGLAQVIPYIIREYMGTGRKFEIAPTSDMNASIYFKPIPATTRTVKVRDVRTGTVLGASDIKTEDFIQVRVKSPVPKHLKTTIRKDVNGNVVK